MGGLPDRIVDLDALPRIGGARLVLAGGHHFERQVQVLCGCRPACVTIFSIPLNCFLAEDSDTTTSAGKGFARTTKWGEALLTEIAACPSSRLPTWLTGASVRRWTLRARPSEATTC